jgi:Protein of unknown function (DUF2867)
VVVVQRRSIVIDESCDYADAFEVAVGEFDSRSAEEVVRAGLQGVPRWLGALVLLAHRHVLRFELARGEMPNHVMGWEVLSADHDMMRLGATGPLMDGVLVARRAGPSAAVLETYVSYRRPALGRIIWTAVAPIHRAVAPYLLRRAAATSAER